MPPRRALEGRAVRQVTKGQWQDAIGKMYRKIRIKVKNNASGLRYIGENKIITGQNQAIGQATDEVFVTVSQATGAINNRISERLQTIWNDLLDTPSAGN